MPEQSEALNRINHLKRKPVSVDKNRQPPKCSNCIYYQPGFRYRKCLFAKCPYGKKEKEVFRKKILSAEKMGRKAVK